MRHVVITGGTRGIGLGLVREFLFRGYNITFCGTSDSSVLTATTALAEQWPAKRFRAVVCDVSKTDDLVNLWDFSTKIFGRVDIWINNAGISNPQSPFNKLDHDTYSRLVDINIKGVMNGTQLAFNNMLRQGGGFIYNTGGLGSDGRMVKGMTAYGTSKRAVQYFTLAFAGELKSDSPVKLGLLLPGMVLTDMLLDPIRRGDDNSKKLKRLYNLLAEEVETVVPVLTDRMISNEKNGSVISFSSPLKMFSRVPGRLLGGRDIVKDRMARP